MEALIKFYLLFDAFCEYHVINFRHPDKNNDPAAENRFVEINQAYEVRRFISFMFKYT